MRSQASRKVRAVIFDYGHTLVDFTVSEEALLAAYGSIRDRLTSEAVCEIPAAEELVEMVAGSVTRAVNRSYEEQRLVELDILALFTEALAGLGFDPSAETVRWVAEIEHRALSARLASPRHVTATLGELRAHGVKVGIVSNAHLLPDLMREDWLRLGWGEYVDGSVISSEIGIRKPDPGIFRCALEKLNVDPAETVFVGDRVYDDVLGAHRMGMKAVLTTEFRDSRGRIQGQREIEALETEQPDLVVDSLDQVLPFVLSEAAS